MNDLTLTNEQINILAGALNVYIAKIQSQDNIDETLSNILDEAIFLKEIIKPFAKKRNVDYKIIINN